MFNNMYTDEIEYREYIGLGKTGEDSYKDTVKIKGLRLKGQLKFSTGSDGDTTSCNICYKTPTPIVKHSKLNGRTVMECVKVSGFGKNCGYVSYVK